MSVGQEEVLQLIRFKVHDQWSKVTPLDRFQKRRKRKSSTEESLERIACPVNLTSGINQIPIEPRLSVREAFKLNVIHSLVPVHSDQESYSRIVLLETPFACPCLVSLGCCNAAFFIIEAFFITDKKRFAQILHMKIILTNIHSVFPKITKSLKHLGSSVCKSH